MTDADAIAEFRSRLLAGHFGDRELMLPIEQTYHGMWSALCERLTALEDKHGFAHPVLAEVRAAMHEIADARPNACEVFALTIAEYGRR